MTLRVPVFLKRFFFFTFNKDKCEAGKVMTVYNWHNESDTMSQLLLWMFHTVKCSNK